MYVYLDPHFLKVVYIYILNVAHLKYTQHYPRVEYCLKNIYMSMITGC
jgi:hypothetical protein